MHICTLHFLPFNSLLCSPSLRIHSCHRFRPHSLSLKSIFFSILALEFKDNANFCSSPIFKKNKIIKPKSLHSILITSHTPFSAFPPFPPTSASPSFPPISASTSIPLPPIRSTMSSITNLRPATCLCKSS